MIYTNTKKVTLQDILQKEFDFQTAHKDSNTAKKLQALNLLQQFFDGLTDDFIFNGLESVKNTGKEVRNFEMFNIGTAVEICLRGLLRGVEFISKAKAKTFDCVYNNKHYEIKASLSGTCKNTPYNNEKNIMLVNKKGVWLLTREQACKVVDKYGRFNPNSEIGEYDAMLSDLLGY